MGVSSAEKIINPGPREMGFGSATNGARPQRMLNPDGTFNVRRHGMGFWSSWSLYQQFMTCSWGRFFGAVTVLYLITNVVFATAYALCGRESFISPPGLFDHHFLRCFFFSVQTLSTIGYGHVAPIGVAANAIATLEAYLGLFMIAVMTGAVFARVARPNLKILFSERALIAPYRGGTGLQVRVANGKKTQLVDVNAQLVLTMYEGSGESRTRRVFSLDLELSDIPFFVLNWTIVHPITEQSPLFGLSEQEVHGRFVEIFVILSGIDDASSQRFHARRSYVADEVLWNARFLPMFEPRTDGEQIAIDLRKINLVEKLTA